MLIKDYYTINEVITREDGATLFQISLRPDCQVYQGHFPGEPVSPGVCNIQMVKECAEQVAGKPLILANLQQCRLTTLVTPVQHPQVEVMIHLEEKGEAYKLKATIGKGEEVYLDLKAELAVIE
ncbi:MAG: beta-hydroxyacyl-ACP dehydratase [Bacteroidaceae bacterium]|nr:beta-hydroxyacyl-ACP dehydratase [Bacteroidaceae bacterium]